MELSQLKSIQTRNSLESEIKAIGPEFSGSYVVERWYHYDEHGGPGLIYLEWEDKADLHGMSVEKIKNALSKLPSIKPASEAYDALEKAGYRNGFPNPENEMFFNPLRVDHLPELRDSKGFVPWSYAYTLNNQTYLLVANVHDGKNLNFLDYAECVEVALTRALESKGIPNPFLSLAFNRGEDALDYIASYSIPATSQDPSLRTWLHAINDVPGSSRLSKKLFQFDLKSLPGLEINDQYPKTAELLLHSSSKAIRPKSFEIAAQNYINKHCKELNIGGATIESDRGPLGPNFLVVDYGYYCVCNDLQDITNKLAKIQGLSRKSDREYYLDLPSIPELANYGDRKVPLRVVECTQGY